MEKQVNLKYSIIIPCYDPKMIKAEVIGKCLSSVIYHSEGYSIEIVPVYNVLGYARAVNVGLRRATGDILIVMNDDIEVCDIDWLEKFSNFRGIVSWRKFPFHLAKIDVPDGACWAMSRIVYETLGDLDEAFNDGYGYEDSDYWFRALEAGYELSDGRIELKHAENLTYQTYWGKDKEAMTGRNHRIFMEKWQNIITKYL